MGFSCGIYAFKKYKDTTLAEYLNIRRYLYWKNNKWNFEIIEKENGVKEARYPTYESYWRSFTLSNKDREFPGDPDPDKLAFYEKWQDDGDDGEIAAHEIGVWYSTYARYIYEDIRSCLKPLNGDPTYLKGLDVPKVIELLRFVADEQDKMRPEPLIITKGYRYVEAEDPEEDPEIQTVAIDGIEMVNDDGLIRRVDCEYSEYEGVFVGNQGFDIDHYRALEQLKDALIKTFCLICEGEYEAYFSY